MLGLYGNGKKKSLTAATEIYKKVRSQVPRSKKLTPLELAQMKRTIEILLQEELSRTCKDNFFPQEKISVTFWVDTLTKKAAGKLEEFKSAHPELRAWRDPEDVDGTFYYFVQDKDDYFLRNDLQSNSKSKGRTNIKFTEETVRIQKLLSIPSIKEAVRLDASTPELSVDSSSRSPYSDSMVDSSRTNDDAFPCFDSMEPFLKSTGMDMDVDTPDRIAKWQLNRITEASSPVFEDQVETLCCQWIDSPPAPMETITRKRSLVDSYKSQVFPYQKSLLGVDPFPNASARSGLRGLHKKQIIETTNSIWNAMMDWYERYPASCLPGEEHSWIKELGVGGEEDSVDTFPTDWDEEMQMMLSDEEGGTLASHYYSHFSEPRVGYMWVALNPQAGQNQTHCRSRRSSKSSNSISLRSQGCSSKSSDSISHGSRGCASKSSDSISHRSTGCASKSCYSIVPQSPRCTSSREYTHSYDGNYGAGNDDMVGVDLARTTGGWWEQHQLYIFIFYVLGFILLEVVVAMALSTAGNKVAVRSFTVTNVIHFAFHLIYLHWMEGGYIELQGELNALTLWEQIEATPGTEWLRFGLRLVPTSVCLLACYEAGFTKEWPMCLFNVSVFFFTQLVKLPIMNGVRISRIDKEV